LSNTKRAEIAEKSVNKQRIGLDCFGLDQIVDVEIDLKGDTKRDLAYKIANGCVETN